MTTMAEPEWDDATRELVLALDAVDICEHCGQPTSICQDPAREFDWVAGDPIRCHAYTAVLARQRGVTEETNPNVSALSWPFMLRDEQEGVARG